MADAIALYCFVAVDKSDVSLGNPFTRHVVILQSLRRAANKKLFSRFSASLKLNQSNISVRPLSMPSNPITSEQMLNQLMNARWMELHQHARDNVSFDGKFHFQLFTKKLNLVAIKSLISKASSRRCAKANNVYRNGNMVAMSTTWRGNKKSHRRLVKCNFAVHHRSTRNFKFNGDFYVSFEFFVWDGNFLNVSATMAVTRNNFPFRWLDIK